MVLNALDFDRPNWSEKKHANVNPSRVKTATLSNFHDELHLTNLGFSCSLVDIVGQLQPNLIPLNAPLIRL